jgi:uncharacterized membrane protein (UPF0127 family)
LHECGFDFVVVLVADEGRVVCRECVVADSIPARLTGLLGRNELLPGEGLLLSPAPSVHTMFMRFPIDLVFLDGQLAVLDIEEAVAPWRVKARRGARAVLELAAGEAARQRISPGTRLRLGSAAADCYRK